MTAVNLATTYLGLRLAHPFMVGASPLAVSLDTVKRLEDGGAAAIVLRSLFEEQITVDTSERIHNMDPLDPDFARALAQFPKPETYPLSPSEYLEHIRRVKAAVRIPVIASLNGSSAEEWVRFAKQIEQAGADALELNIYDVAVDPRESAPALEALIRDVVIDVKHTIAIPLAVKLGPFFTAFGHLARELEIAGANGLVIFNRFYQPDIDVNAMAPVLRLELSTNAELLLRLRWLSALRGRVRCSLAASGGVATPIDGIKALLAGADGVQLVSAVLRHGPGHFAAMREGLIEWMARKGLTSIDQVRGAVAASQPTGLDERGTYIRTLQSWMPNRIAS
jgi:dihydroorotate dehydrogenase (fumarate)